MAAAINKSFFMGVENVCKFVEIVYPVVRRKLLQTKTTLSEKSRYFHFVAGRNSKPIQYSNDQLLMSYSFSLLGYRLLK